MYFPHQPLFKNLNGYVEIINNSHLINNIALYYKFKMDEMNLEHIFVVPDGCIDIIFCCDKKNPTAHICGSVIKGKKVRLKTIFHLPNKTSSEFFGVRFFPGCANDFLRHPLKDFTDKEIPLTEAVENSWSLIDCIASQNNFNIQIEFFRDFLNRLYQNDTDSKIAKYFIYNIIKNNGIDKIDDLAKKFGYSTRYICKIFEKYIGISPKLFSRVVRFQKSIEILSKYDQSRLGDLALELGYYDQSHFIREFKEFCWLTPYQIANKKEVKLLLKDV